METNYNEQQGTGVKRIVLPSGKTIEVVSFSDLTQELASKAEAIEPGYRRSPASNGLHVCPDCSSHLVYPTEWEEENRSRWQVWLHCPNCDWLGDGVYEQQVLDEFDEELDRGMEELAADLSRLSRANMADAVDRFAAALAADAIQPMDF
jgi:hypothetical protein